jgi:16S rRNA (uracil1498-N3)-methyltransferase
MRLHRFYVNKPLGEEIVVENTEGEKELIHQWIHVFRYKSGDEVFLFSPSTSGLDFLYRISSISKKAVTLHLVSSSPSIMSLDITLVMALVKKDTFETIVRQATELGVSRIIPVQAARSEKKKLNFERLSAISIEATEQSGRGSVPLLDPISSFDETLALLGDHANIFGSFEGISATSTLSGLMSTKKPYALWVGPEGGWTEEEEKKAKNAGFSLLKLTDTVLRADTAAVSLISLFAIRG